MCYELSTSSSSSWIWRPYGQLTETYKGNKYRTGQGQQLFYNLVEFYNYVSYFQKNEE
jgi:hypothetical protein